MIRGYNLYGLKINTPQKFLEFKAKPVYKRPDITIKFGKVERPIKTYRTVHKAYTVYSEWLYFQEVPTIAKYLFTGKKEVVIDPAPNHPINEE